MSTFHGHVKTPDERLFQSEPEVATTTVGLYLAQRLVEAGSSTFFTVPGDYTLGLLDSLLKNKTLKMIGCCNELNAGYAGKHI
jgi:TPP-dependent 2-oxoacid decarboxylase